MGHVNYCFFEFKVYPDVCTICHGLMAVGSWRISNTECVHIQWFCFYIYIALVPTA